MVEASKSNLEEWKQVPMEKARSKMKKCSMHGDLHKNMDKVFIDLMRVIKAKMSAINDKSGKKNFKERYCFVNATVMAEGSCHSGWVHAQKTVADFLIVLQISPTYSYVIL